ncbi:MAG: 3'(2'),5'-bisphosphate nucleotidase CysQ [Rhodobacteraceae bacterium]|nr:3'(2'),5'-bisphosphate nucleotidase CysQ [Paracoccaceae bacterium]
MPAADLALLQGAAEAAGEIAKRYFKASPETWDKGAGQGPVTEADLAINRMLKAELLAARPDYGWLSEESEDNAARLDRKRVFIIDPIDGTRAFINGESSFSHALAIAENGKVITAVVHVPMKAQIFTATLGGGARCNGKLVSVSAQAGMSGARVLSRRPDLKPEHWRAPHQMQHHFRPSLAYRLCLVANGRYDAMLTLRPAWEWDVAAGELIVREAGGCVTTAAGDKTCYNNPVPKLAGMVAAPQKLVQNIIAALQPAAKQPIAGLTIPNGE